jgi:hypothetical protein
MEGQARVVEQEMFVELAIYRVKTARAACKMTV